MARKARRSLVATSGVRTRLFAAAHLVLLDIVDVLQLEARRLIKVMVVLCLAQLPALPLGGACTITKLHVS